MFSIWDLHIGQHVSVFYPEEKVEAGSPDELLATALAEGSVEDEGWRVREDGSEFWANVVITAVSDKGGTHQGFLIVTRDMSDQRQRETSSDDTSTNVDDQLLEQALNQAPVGVTISGPPAEDVPLIYVSESFTELTGYSRDDVLGRNCRFLQGEDTSPDPVTTMHEAIDAREGVSVELRNYRKDGTEFWNQVWIAPIRDETGTVTNYVGFQQDITERKRKERQLERQNKRLDEFASVISHDLRNPLQVADGRLELIREECESDHIDDVGDALDRMDTLIEDLLTLAREGDRIGEVERVVLADLIEDCRQNIAAPEAEIVTECDRTIHADRSRLQQLLENLLRNAVEHGGADVTVIVGELETGFYVEGDGPGIPEADRDDVFEAGYSKSAEGTGFGLRIVKQVVDAHGWEITVTESEEGGARFEITGVEFVDR